MIVLDTINNIRKTIDVVPTDTLQQIKVRIWEVFGKEDKYLPVFLVIQNDNISGISEIPVINFYSFIDFGIKKMIPYYQSSGQDLTAVLLDPSQDPHRRAKKMLGLDDKQADEVMKILIYLTEPDMFFVFKNDMDFFISQNTPGQKKSSPKKITQRLPVRLPPRITTNPVSPKKTSPVKPKSPSKTSQVKKTSPVKPKSPSKTSQVKKTSPVKPKSPSSSVKPKSPSKPSQVKKTSLVKSKSPQIIKEPFLFTQLNLKFVMAKINIPEDVLLNDTSLDSTVVAVKSGEKHKYYGSKNDTIEYFITRRLRGEQRCVLLFDSQQELYYFWDFKNKNALLIDTKPQRIYESIDLVVDSFKKTVNYFIEKVNKYIKEERQLQSISDPQFVLSCEIVIPQDLVYVFSQKQKYAYIANKMGFTAIVNQNNVLKISYKTYETYVLIKRESIDINKVVSLVQLDWWVKSLKKVLNAKEQARDRLGDIIEDTPILQKRESRLSIMKKSGVPVNSRMCQKERQPVIISDESQMKGNYSLRYMNLLFDCPDSPYKNPGFIKDVPCCFITDQREEQRIFTTNEKYQGKFIAKKGDNWYLIDNRNKQLIAITDLPIIDSIDKLNPVLLGPIPLSKVFTYSSEAECKVRPESLENELCPPDTSFGYLKKGGPCCFRGQKKQTTTRQSYIIKTGKTLKATQIGEVPDVLINLLQQPIYRMGLKEVDIPFLGHISDVLSQRTLLQDMATFYSQNPQEYNKVQIENIDASSIVSLLKANSKVLQGISKMSLARLVALVIRKNIVVIDMSSDITVEFLTGLDVYATTIVLLKNGSNYEVIVKKTGDRVDKLFTKEETKKLYNLYEPEAYSLDSMLRSGLITIDSQMINCFGYTEYLVTDMKLIIPIKPSNPSLVVKEVPFTVFNHEPQIRYLNSFGRGWQVKAIVKDAGYTVALVSENGLITPVHQTQAVIEYPAVPGVVASEICKPPSLKTDPLLNNMKQILVFVNKERYNLSRYFANNKVPRGIAESIILNAQLSNDEKSSSIANILKDYYTSSGIPEELFKMFINEIITDIRKKRIVSGKVEKDDIKINNTIVRPDEFSVVQ